MDYAYEERIGSPDLFTGREAELAYFLKWINDIKDEKSMSTALLARRKMGKSAIMERLFNITFFKNDGVIPFYYEVKETKMWLGDFCKDFFRTRPLSLFIDDHKHCSVRFWCGRCLCERQD